MQTASHHCTNCDKDVTPEPLADGNQSAPGDDQAIGECPECCARMFADDIKRLYVPVNSEPTTEAEKIEAISHDFAMRLSMEIGDDNLREAVQRNALPNYKGCCASHDFCDANMVMLDSMRAWGYEVFTAEGFMDDDQTRIMNAAWDQAKLYNFDI